MATRRSSKNKRAQAPSHRSQSPRSNVKGSRSRVDNLNRRMPPVMVRSGVKETIGSTKKKDKRKRVKRRFDVTVPTPGASGVEVRLPSLPVVQISWRILSLVMTATLLFLIYYMLSAENFLVQAIDVQGTIRVSTDEISQSLGVINQPVFELAPKILEQTLDDDFVELKDISVQIGFPAQVIVSVNERVPLIEWVEDNGVKWIDGDGFAFPQRGEADKLVTVLAYTPPISPVFTQVESGDQGLMSEDQAYMSSGLVEAILKMRSKAPEGTNLVYDSEHGLGWRDANGWDVFFGWNGDDIEVKLQVYQAIAQKVQSEGITPALINVEHVHAPYYRMER